MAEEEKAEGGGAADAAASGPKESKLPLLITLVNTLAILAALGTFVYTRILFKRPAITEGTERAKLEERAKEEVLDLESGTIEIKSFTANIRPTDLKPEPGSAPGGDNLKLHYVTVSLFLEIKDSGEQGSFEEIRSKFMDKLIQVLGKKQYIELITVQGRYILRNEILEAANTLLKKNLITNVFFTEFIVQ